MSAFISIGNVKQAALATVAPGIAEALIAPAMGLVAAIPAVIAYNFFTPGVDRLDSPFKVFFDKLVGIIEPGLRSGKAEWARRSRAAGEDSSACNPHTTA